MASQAQQNGRRIRGLVSHTYPHGHGQDGARIPCALLVAVQVDVRQPCPELASGWGHEKGNVGQG